MIIPSTPITNKAGELGTGPVVFFDTATELAPDLRGRYVDVEDLLESYSL